MAPYWPGHPSAFENLAAELASDHSVVIYDARGTGESTRQGPYDMETGAGDLAAVAEAAGGDAVIVTLTDSVNRGVRVAASRPDLARAVVAPGVAPIDRDTLRQTDSMIGSDNVLEAVIEMLKTSYRSVLQTVVPPGNEQMSDEEMQRRIDIQADYCPQEASLGMLEAWIEDDPVDAGRAVGDRLWILYSDALAGPWLPTGDEVLELMKRMLPEARFMEAADGIVSRPDLTAKVIRELTSEA